jgi:hypothetical protein
MTPEVRSELLSTIARRLTPKPVKVRSDLELTCYSYEGINGIKAALRAGEALSTEQVPIKIRLVAPPLYVMSTTSTDKNAAIDLMEQALAKIGEEIEKFDGAMNVAMRVSTLSSLVCFSTSYTWLLIIDCFFSEISPRPFLPSRTTRLPDSWSKPRGRTPRSRVTKTSRRKSRLVRIWSTLYHENSRSDDDIIVCLVCLLRHEGPLLAGELPSNCLDRSFGHGLPRMQRRVVKSISGNIRARSLLPFVGFRSSSLRYLDQP